MQTQTTTNPLRLEIAKIFPSPTNPRKTFDEAKLNELAVSIKEHDVVQAIKVRPHPTKAGSFMLVVGERRLRAAEIAGLEDIPAIVETLTDLQVCEQQIIENSQRVDVHPIEEADAYQELLDKHGYTIDTLVAKIGKSRSHLYGRLKLRDLIPSARKACLEGKLAPACAELVARADPKVQPEFLKDALGQSDRRGYHEHGIDAEGVNPEESGWIATDHQQPLSFRALQQLYHRKYTLRLDAAPFAIYDGELVKVAGPCTSCPKRTGGQPELFPDLKKPADSCTDPKCFESKVKAHWSARAESAKAMGYKIVEGKDAKGAVSEDGKGGHNSDYVSLDQELPYDVAKPGSHATFKKLLGKLEETVPKVLVQDERGGAHLLLDKKAAIKVLRDAGKLDEAKKKPGSASLDAAYRKERAKEKEKRALKTEAFKRVLEDIGAGAKDFDIGGKKTLPLMRLFARELWLHADFFGDPGEMLETIYGAKPSLSKALENAIDEAKTATAVLAIVAVLMAAAEMDTMVSEHGGKSEQFEQLCTLFGADWKDAIARATTASKVEEKADATKDKAKPAAAKAKPAKKKSK